MSSSRITPTLLSLIAIFAIAYGAMTRPAAAGMDAVEQAAALPQLEENAGAADSAALQGSCGLFAGASLVEVPRRLVGIRQHVQLRHLTDSPADDPCHTALLRLRDAMRDRLAMGDLLERDASGAASFHTATPPPNTPV